MSDYGTMQTRIQTELNRSDLSSEIRDAIKTSINHHESERFYFMEARSTLDTVTDQEYYALPTNFQEPDILSCTFNGYKYKLRPQTFNVIEEKQANTSWTGEPKEYCIYSSQLRLYPVPDDAYRLELGYVKKLSDLSATGDTNAWMVDAEELIRTRAKVDLLENRIRGSESFQEAAQLRIREAQALSQLRLETNRRRATGRLKPTRF